MRTPDYAAGVKLELEAQDGVLTEVLFDLTVTDNDPGDDEAQGRGNQRVAGRRRDLVVRVGLILRQGVV